MSANPPRLGNSSRLPQKVSRPLRGEKSIHRRNNVLHKNRAIGGGDITTLIGQQLSSTYMTSLRHTNDSSRRKGLGTRDVPQLKRDISTNTTNDEESKCQNGKYLSDLVVVLDMDECLIHSEFLDGELVDKYRQVEDRLTSSSTQQGNNEEASGWSTCESFKIQLPDGDLAKVNKRPLLDVFLKEVTSKFETYIFTAAMEVNNRFSTQNFQMSRLQLHSNK